MISTAIVTTRDGVQFAVQIYARTDAQSAAAIAAEQRFASTVTADVLRARTDYTEVKSLDDLLGPALSVDVVLAPRPRSNWRDSAYVIKGGKS